MASALYGKPDQMYVTAHAQTVYYCPEMTIDLKPTITSGSRVEVAPYLASSRRDCIVC